MRASQRDMATPRYLVTGGAGFIGSNLVAALDRRRRARAASSTTSRPGAGSTSTGIPQQSLDRAHRRATSATRRRSRAAAKGVEVVFHEAALGSVPRSVETPIESNAVNVGGTVTVLDVARRQGVRRVIFAASSAAYGETPALPKHEDMTPMPLSPYAVTKLACEHYLKVFAGIYGLETLSLRYFNVFGPNQTPDGAYAAAIPRFIDAALAGRPIQIFGDGEQTRDFCYIDNTVRANLLARDVAEEARGRGRQHRRRPPHRAERALQRDRRGARARRRGRARRAARRATSATRSPTSRARTSSSATSRACAGRTASPRRSRTCATLREKGPSGRVEPR